MEHWKSDILYDAIGTSDERKLFEKIEAEAKLLGFDFCAYGMRHPIPIANPKIFTVNNYPEQWTRRYQEMCYIARDPTIAFCSASTAPIRWSDALFTSEKELWDEAKMTGLCFGWAQSSVDANGYKGMLTLARTNDEITGAELAANEFKLRWLVQVTHQAMVQALSRKNRIELEVKLTNREIEILRWTAEGKTTSEISQILAISDNTVNFHIKNVINKFSCANKTAAVVRAAILGLLT